MNFVEPFILLFILSGYIGLTYHLRQEYLQELKEGRNFLIFCGSVMFAAAAIWGTFPGTYLSIIVCLYAVPLYGAIGTKLLPIAKRYFFRKATT